MGAFDRDYAFGADAKPTRYVDPPATFMGIVRADGRVATRNYIGLLSTVNCSATVVRGIADAFRGEALAQFPNVDGVVALTHGSGCGMDTHGDGMKLLRRTLAGYARHANFAGVLVVGLGCEANQISSLFGAENLQEGPLLRTFSIQDTGGTAKTIAHGVDIVRDMLPHANAVTRAARAGVAHHRRPAVRRIRRLLRASPRIPHSARRSTCWFATAARRSCRRRPRSTAPSTC